ncbi:MAG: hypothetical protein GX620_12700 [Chloroflexi bacterium]|nr:hypothetical protein [Chloroflexota bacterium]
MESTDREYNSPYAGEYLSRVAFPLGGIGAGMVCLEGTGGLSHGSLRGRPEVFNELPIFSAVCVKGAPNLALALEGPVPAWKAFGTPGSGNGGYQKTYGLPRFAEAEFDVHFPFADINLSEPQIPLQVRLTGWSPFAPGDADSSSLPVAALEYRFANPTDACVDAVFSFHAANFMATRAGGDAVQATDNGFVLWQSGSDARPWEEGAFAAVVDDPETRVDCAWFRGRWSDVFSIVWQSVMTGVSVEKAPISEGEPSPGGSLYVPFRLEAGEEKTICVKLAWYVPSTNLRVGKDVALAAAASESCCCGDGCTPAGETHRPWYAAAFDGIESVLTHWRQRYDALRVASQAFSDCFYDSTLPPEVIEAVAANLTILKSPTMLRQPDGRLWCWEGCCDDTGCCPGSCTHVWNYAQALPHLFPDLERSLRQTEYHENQDEGGHQMFRAGLPIRPILHDFHAAADGQLGGIMKVYREWRISGDGQWLREFWPKVKQSLDYCIETWDPGHKGVTEEPHHNTYDVEFWGPDGMCTSFYLGALSAAIAMAEALGEDAPLYRELLERGRRAMESELWDGEYFIQRVEWEKLQAGDPTEAPSFAAHYSPEAEELLRKEGPKYQYGTGCLSDGVLGAWMAKTCGLDDFLDARKVTSHLLAVHRYNFREDLYYHFNPVRPTFAMGHEPGLLLCTWPKGADLTLPFYFGYEVWTGIEYQVASHLMMVGHIEEGLEIVRAVRDRYDGRVRNPFNEYECGHWYARAMASYALLQGLTGARYDAVEQTLYIAPQIPGDFRSFLSTATGYGIVGVRDGEPFLEVRHGDVAVGKIVYRSYNG